MWCQKDGNAGSSLNIFKKHDFCNMTARERVFRGIKAFAQGFFIGVPVYLTITDNLFTVCPVEGASMQPVLNPGHHAKDVVFINRLKAKRLDKIERGDIVSIVSPKDPSTVFIKRIIALEGDKIRTLGFKNRIVEIPRGHCWIEGDNQKISLDSNSFGFVPLGLVNGVATRTIWPPSRWSKLSKQLPLGRNPFDISDNELNDNDKCHVENDVTSDVINMNECRKTDDNCNNELANLPQNVNTCVVTN